MRHFATVVVCDFGYLDLVGAGHTSDLDRVRIAHNLGVLVIGWAQATCAFTTRDAKSTCSAVSSAKTLLL